MEMDRNDDQKQSQSPSRKTPVLGQVEVLWDDTDFLTSFQSIQNQYTHNHNK